MKTIKAFCVALCVMLVFVGCLAEPTKDPEVLVLEPWLTVTTDERTGPELFQVLRFSVGADLQALLESHTDTPSVEIHRFARIGMGTLGFDIQNPAMTSSVWKKVVEAGCGSSGPVATAHLLLLLRTENINGRFQVMAEADSGYAIYYGIRGTSSNYFNWLSIPEYPWDLEEDEIICLLED